MSTRFLRTTELADALAVHPNTIRQYEAWGFLPPIPRSPAGYRRFTLTHLHQMRLARSLMNFSWLGGDIRRTALAALAAGAAADWGGVLEHAHRLLALVRSERVQAEAAIAYLERWARGIPTGVGVAPLRIQQAARLLDVSADVLRNWERDGLLDAPRDPHNGYRAYGPAEIGRLRVIRTLRQARYSTMAILRMLLALDRALDRGEDADVRRVLDTPDADEDVWSATDRWLSTLAHLEPRAHDLIAQVEALLHPPADAPTSRDPIADYFGALLATALDRLAAHNLLADCRLYGSAATRLQGIPTPVRDLNLLLRSAEHGARTVAALADLPCLDAPPARVAFLVRGVALTLDAGCEGLEGADLWEHALPVTCGAHTLLATPPEVRLAAELARAQAGRQAYIAPLLRALRRRGANLPRLRAALAVYAIPTERCAAILKAVE